MTFLPEIVVVNGADETLGSRRWRLPLLISVLPWIGAVSSTLRSTSTVPGVTPARNVGVTFRSGTG